LNLEDAPQAALFVFLVIQRFLAICVRRARGQTIRAAAGGAISAIFGDIR
jgi:hypothetical protein